MRKTLWFVLGTGAAATAWLTFRRKTAKGIQPLLDLNTCDYAELSRLLGADEALTENVIENRPYRSKLDLVSRFVVPGDVYRQIKDRIYVDDRAAHQAVNIA